MTLSNGVIGGVSTTAGTSAFTITATDSAGTQTQSATSINIRSATPDLVLIAGSVSFALATGATGPPPAQTVGVQSAAVAQTLSYTIASSTAPWLSVTGDGTTPGYLSFSLTGAALSLPVGTSAASVTLTCTTAACAGKTQNVAVSLVVASPSPQLSVASTLLTFRSHIHHAGRAIAAVGKSEYGWRIPFAIASIRLRIHMVQGGRVSGISERRTVHAREHHGGSFDVANRPVSNRVGHRNLSGHCFDACDVPHFFFALYESVSIGSPVQYAGGRGAR